MPLVELTPNLKLLGAFAGGCLATLLLIGLLRANAPMPGDLDNSDAIMAAASVHMLETPPPEGGATYLTVHGFDPDPRLLQSIRSQLPGRDIRPGSAQPEDSGRHLSINLHSRPLLGVGIVRSSSDGCWSEMVLVGLQPHWKVVSDHWVCR